tara:strand:- start:340 stop:480 length:141 start_codon:yes stop_codon:yes gene_type:complete
MKLKTLKRKEYWEALFIVRFNQTIVTPLYIYGWWKSRLSLIKQDEI